MAKKIAKQKIKELQIKTAKDKKITWLNIVNAGEQELEELKTKYNFNAADLHDARAGFVNFHAKINVGENYLFLVLHFPYLKKAEAVSGTEVDFFVGRDYIITLHEKKLKALELMFAGYSRINGNNKNKIDSSIDLFYKIIDGLLGHCYDLLDEISKNSDEIEDLIFSWESKKSIARLLNLRRSTINIRTITQNYQIIFAKFKKLAPEVGIVDQRTPYTSVIEKTKDLLGMIENKKETVEALYATNESISNYRLNDIMKTLTIFSVIVFPLTLLAAIFGMNTMNSMPFVENPYDFWIIVVIMLLGCLGMLGFFKWKKWI